MEEGDGWVVMGVH